MTLFLKCKSFLYSSAVTFIPVFTVKSVQTNFSQRVFCAALVRFNHDRFTLTQKKKKSRKHTTNVGKVSWRQSQVFQLDPLKGQHAPVVSDTIRQHAVSGAILQGITDILMCHELDHRLRDYQVEITQVKTTRDLGHATIYWSVPDELEEHKQSIQNLFDENADHIRRLLPAYTRLNRFPRLMFTKDKKTEYAREVECLLKEAESIDSCKASAEESIS